MATEALDDGFPTHVVTLDGVWYARVPYGSAEYETAADRRSCRDCGVVKGEYHVYVHCSVEGCPKCGGQLACCECEFLGDEPEVP